MVARRPDGIDAGLDLSGVPDAPRARRVVEQVVSGVDIAPTIADYAGVALPDAHGESLRGLIEGASEPRAPVYIETWLPRDHHGWSELVAVQDRDHRLERGVHDTWWDLGRRARHCRRVLELERSHATGVPPPRRRRGLRCRGGRAEERGPPASGGDHGTPTATALPDPRDQLHLLARLHTAAGTEDLARLVAEAPAMADARVALALALAQDGRPGAALTELDAVLAAHPFHPGGLETAALLALESGQHGRLAELAADMKQRNDADPQPYRLLAAGALADQRLSDVVAAASAGLERDHDDPRLHYLRARGELDTQPARALEDLAAARRLGARETDLDMWEGVAHHALGDIDAAKAAYARATLETPEDPRAYAFAGVMLYEAGRCEEARPFLVNLVGRGVSEPRVLQAVAACRDATSHRGIGD